MKLKTTAVAVAAAISLAPQAQASGLGFEANGARSNGVWGAELGAGYRWSLGVFDVTPAGGLFVYKGDTGEYFITKDRDGTERCRDGGGRFADKERCDGTAVKGYARIEAGVSIPLVARLGAGARLFGGDVRPYGTVSASLFPKVSAKVNAGKKYVAAGLTVGF